MLGRVLIVVAVAALAAVLAGCGSDAEQTAAPTSGDAAANSGDALARLKRAADRLS